jgi:hypothetical protein
LEDSEEHKNDADVFRFKSETTFAIYILGSLGFAEV